MKTRKARSAKTNPLGCTHEPWLARQSAATEFRCRVRDALESRSAPALAAVESMLGSFAPESVRGDYVPTIADAYAQAVAIANQPDASTSATALPLAPSVQMIFTPAGRFRVEVRLVPV